LDIKVYQQQVVKNIQAMVEAFKANNIPVVSNGSDNHLCLIDTYSTYNVTGHEASDLLSKAKITCNKNGIPFDTLPPMKTSGLEDLANPSQMFLEERSKNLAGATIISTMEGSRPLLVEIQSLTTPTAFNNPRRISTGLEYNKLILLMAVLEKKAGYLLQQQDVYVKVSGGVKIDDPAVDLGVVVAVASAAGCSAGFCSSFFSPQATKNKLIASANIANFFIVYPSLIFCSHNTLFSNKNQVFFFLFLDTCSYFVFNDYVLLLKYLFIF